MALKTDEIGKILEVNAAFDMSSNSDLELNFVKPDGTTLTVNKAGGVSAPAVDSTSGSGFLANEYWSYAFQAGDLDQAGLWVVSGRYVDTTPKDFCGDAVQFTVLQCGVVS